MIQNFDFYWTLTLKNYIKNKNCWGSFQIEESLKFVKFKVGELDCEIIEAHFRFQMKLEMISKQEVV